MTPSSFFLLLLLSGGAVAQPASFSAYGTNPAQFNSSMAVIVVVLISVFFLMGFLSIYLRHCADPDEPPPTAAGPRWRRPARAGLDPAAIDRLPTLVYADVKEHKLGKGALECAVCLAEFDDDDELRLLPSCDHVFHPACIAAWLSQHATCPVCRADLAAAPPPPPPPPSPPPRLSRSNSTGHSIVVVHVADDGDRFTLRLPDHVRRDVIAGKLRRSTSFGGAAAPAPARWAFFSVVLSALSPKRDGDDVAGLAADGSGKQDRTARTRFDCLGGAADVEKGSPRS
ncbi:E3 ubiquitin-protein ligase ATL31-like [Wolffia australiana]